jgi:hypothetical protein
VCSPSYLTYILIVFSLDVKFMLNFGKYLKKLKIDIKDKELPKMAYNLMVCPRRNTYLLFEGIFKIV